MGEIYTKLRPTLTAAGAESDVNPAANGAKPDRSHRFLLLRPLDHFKKKWRVASFGESPSDTHSRSASTIYYGVTAILQPTTITTRKK